MSDDAKQAAATRIAPCLWFDGQALPAAEFYAATFPDSRIDRVLRSPADYPAGKAGDVLTVEFTVLGSPFLGLNGGSGVRFSEAVSFQVYTDSQEETDRYWDAIVGNGGQPGQCSWCKDRFGLSWQVVPRALLRALASPDREAGRAAMAAMMSHDQDRHRRDRSGVAAGRWMSACVPNLPVLLQRLMTGLNSAAIAAELRPVADADQPDHNERGMA